MNKNRLRDPWPRRRDANRDRDTGHVDIGPGGRIGVAAEVIVLLQIGLVAVGALVIPSLVAPSPVQRATRLELLIGVEMKPAFAAFFFRAAVPCDAERLITPSGKGNQVLLQRIYPEGVGDPVIVQCAIGAWVRTINLSPARQKAVVTPRCSQGQHGCAFPVPGYGAAAGKRSA